MYYNSFCRGIVYHFETCKIKFVLGTFKNMSTKSEELFKNLLNYLETLDNNQWNLKVTNEWTVKDVVSHLIGWNIEASKELPKVWELNTTPWFLNTDSYDDFNRKYVELHKQDPPERVLHEFIESEQKFNQSIQKIGENKLRGKIDKYYWVFDEGEDSHYMEHLRQIKAVVETK